MEIELYSRGQKKLPLHDDDARTKRKQKRLNGYTIRHETKTEIRRKQGNEMKLRMRRAPTFVFQFSRFAVERVVLMVPQADFRREM